MIRIAVFDIDGTLFHNPSKTFPDSTIRAIESLRKRGTTIVIASGRPVSANKTLAKHGIKAHYMIGNNGATVIKTDDQTLLRTIRFNPDFVARVSTYCEAQQIGLMWKSSTHEYIYVDDPVFIPFSKQTQDTGVTWEFATRAAHTQETPSGGCIFSTPEKIASFTQVFRNDCFLAPITTQAADLLSYDVTKAAGLHFLLDHLGFSADECFAIGDNHNDIEMIQLAGLGVAMGNADPILKDQADYITTDILDNGIANALAHFGLLD